MLTQILLACALVAGVPADGDGGGIGIAECGSFGSPGCATEARRWWGVNRATPDVGGSRTGGSGVIQRPSCTTAPAQAPAGAPASGRWVLITCPGQAPLLVRDGGALEGEPGDDAPAITPIMVALMARDRFTLPSPTIASSPKPSDPQLVRLPIWLAVGSGVWHPYTSSASAGGITATATATPTTVTWSMGDGTTRTCSGPGTLYKEGRDDPREESPTCGHTYLRSSEKYRVVATITWAVTWSAAGQSGVLPPLVTTAAAGFRVAESQAIVTT
ncbi:hypothetical protein [Nonomuraea endophytica]|uniref:hypothetical protein n=1 Tax=Nonomuraea endophytica TaxID=714136 RepID=UPI0037C61C52